MVTESVRDLAEVLPELQTPRGAEFREISVEDRYGMARQLVVARESANNSGEGIDGDKWESRKFRKHMRRKKEMYYYQCGRLSIDVRQADAIWWKAVYGQPGPHERRRYI